MEKQTAFKSWMRLSTRSKELWKNSGFEPLPESSHLVQMKTYNSKNIFSNGPFWVISHFIFLRNTWITHHGLKESRIIISILFILRNSRFVVRLR